MLRQIKVNGCLADPNKELFAYQPFKTLFNISLSLNPTKVIFLLPITQHPIGWPHPPPLPNSINSTSEYRSISIQMAYTTEDGVAPFEFGSTTWKH